MPLLENLVEGFSQAAGNEGAVRQIETRKAERKQTSDQELQYKTGALLDSIGAIHQRKQALDPKSPTYQKDAAEADTQLAKAREAFNALYHPAQNPGALGKLGGFLRSHIARRKPGPVPSTPAEAKQSFGQTLGGLESYAYSPQAGQHNATVNPILAKRKERQEAGWSEEQIRNAEEYDAGLRGRPAGAKPAIDKKKGLKYDANTDEVVDQDTARRFTRADRTAPEEVRAMFTGAASAQQKKQQNALDLAKQRGAAYGLNRPISVLDSRNGNQPTEVTMGDIKKEPGRYQPSGPAMQALTQENLMQDIAGTSQQARDAVTNLKEDFPPEMRAKLAVAMRDNDPGGALGQLISSGALGSLTEDQQDFLIAINQLTENAMAMRAVLKTGAGAEDIRSAIRNTLPGVLSPDKSFALRQLDAFDKTLARLHRGVPRVTLPNATPGDLKKQAAETAGRGGEKSFDLNGEIYDVPADKVAVFRRKHPDAKEQ